MAHYKNHDITIVTAFFDIGRGDWGEDDGFSFHLRRSTETYLERFSHMAKLHNDMVVYTTHDIADIVFKLREGSSGKTSIVQVPFKDSFMHTRNLISQIQNDQGFRDKVDQRQLKMPEYWSADYVLVNYLKSFFVTHAIKSIDIRTNLVAWLDFGYVREPELMNGCTHWKYPFDEEKIHMFNFTDVNLPHNIFDLVTQNVAPVFGAKIVASKRMWSLMKVLIDAAFMDLVNNSLIDDDQTLMYMAYTYQKEAFEMHRINPRNPFTVFKEYNIIEYNNNE